MLQQKDLKPRFNELNRIEHEKMLILDKIYFFIQYTNIDKVAEIIHVLGT